MNRFDPEDEPMNRRRFFHLMARSAGVAAQAGMATALFAEGKRQERRGGILGMYVHEGWPYMHPYAARTWTIDDWRGYADGLKKLGYNLLVIWPALETMPEPLTPSDHACLERTAKVIDVLHREFDMLAFLTLCPNVVARNDVAARSSFEQRYYYTSTAFLNPTDRQAVARMMKWRESLLRPLANMDGIAIIDSDPGGYPGSTNDDFVNLLAENRKMLDRLRPGIELYYWMHVGWEAYSHYYATGEFSWGTPAASEDILTRLQKANLRPWGITIHTLDPPPNGTDLDLARRHGLASTALAFNYGAIEGEPSFPMTRFGGNAAFKAGGAVAPRGVVGNAQTHCAQLPNTFAFARGAQGRPVAESDYIEFADKLIAGQGHLIVRAWQVLESRDSNLMRDVVGNLEGLSHESLTPGPLRGLLFGNPQRFITDLIYELRMKAAYLDLVAASQDKVDREKFRAFLAATKAWQEVHGYQTVWFVSGWPGLEATLRKLKSPAINRLLDEADWTRISLTATGNTPFECLQDFFRKWDNHTPRLIEAMSAALQDLEKAQGRASLSCPSGNNISPV
jgi:hypothetical protein